MKNLKLIFLIGLCALLSHSCSRKEKWFLRQNREYLQVSDSETEAAKDIRLEEKEAFDQWKEHHLELLHYWELNGNVVIGADGQIYTDQAVLELWHKENNVTHAQSTKSKLRTYLQKLKETNLKKAISNNNVLKKLKSKINFNLLFLILIILGVWGFWRGRK